MTINKAVILARGLGTRMRADDEGAKLDPRQRAAAAKGLKALMPVADSGKCLLDFIVGSLAEAGLDDVCLVIGPEHDEFRQFVAERGLKLSFAVQNEPLGTADAVLAAEKFAAGDAFVVVNSDNLYPVDGLRALASLDGPGLLGFRSPSLVAKSNIPAERIAKFATVETDADGFLARVVEKPDVVPDNALVSMNAWAFTPRIFDACRAIGPSPRGEFEITAAVMHSVTQWGERFRVIESDDGVLDLSSRADIASATRLLDGK